MLNETMFNSSKGENWDIFTFCDDHIWDSALFWNNSWPQTTRCFQNTILLPLPCYYAIFSLFVYICCLWRRKPSSVHWDLMFVLKLFVCGLLIATEIVPCFLKSNSLLIGSAVYLSIIKTITYVLVLLTVILEQKCSMLQSPLLFLFFLLLLLTHVVPFYSRIILQEYETSVVSFVLFYFNFGTILCATVLYGFNNKHPNFKPSSIEADAPLLSKFTLNWVMSLVVKGYKKPLTETDIFSLKNSEKSETVVLSFLENLSKYSRGQAANASKYKDREHQNLNTNFSKSKQTLHYPPLVGKHPSHKVTAEAKEEEIFSDLQNENFCFLPSAESHETSRSGIVLWKVILRTFWKQVLKCCLLSQLAKVFTLLCPVLLKLFIDFSMAKDEPVWHGYLLATALFLSSVLSQIIYESYMFQCNLTTIRVRAALVSAIYRKIFSLCSEAKQAMSSGEIIELISKDADIVYQMVDEGFQLTEAPVELVVGIIMIYYTVGVAVFAALGTLVVFFTIRLIASRLQLQCEEELRGAADRRMKITSQVFAGIKVLKLYAWEEAFKSRMNDIRRDELKAVFKFSFLRFASTFAWTGAFFWLTFFTFLTYVLVDQENYLTASVVFVTISYLEILRRASNCFSESLDYFISGFVSSRRLFKFFDLKDIHKSTADQDFSDMTKIHAIEITDGSFGWTSNSESILKNICLQVKKSSLVAVVGMVGSGKSSLLSAILGEMVVHSGRVKKQGIIGYVPQEAWIQHNTLRDNILFGSEMRDDEYTEVIKACALRPDLEVLPSGDDTEIGENGINLSGGQKQRVSLARAVYHKSDIYLLDDPLSAVDSHVGRHIFDHVIGKNGLLKNNTRVLVTHGLQWLPEVDKVFVMTDGQCTEQGSFEELMSHNGPFSQFLSQYLSQQQAQTEGVKIRDGNVNLKDEEESVPINELENEETRKDIFQRLVSIESCNSDIVNENELELKKQFEENNQATFVKQESMKAVEAEEFDASSKLIKEEEIASGRVSWSVYTSFWKSMGYFSVSVMSLLFLSCFVFELVAGFWLSYWVDSPLLNNHSLPAHSPERHAENIYYVSIYSIWGILEIVAMIIFTIIKAFQHRLVARNIYERLINSILTSPIQFFDTTPIGRVLSRVSKDMGVVDLTLLMWMEIWLHSIFAILCMIIANIINMPVYLVVIIPVVLLFYFIEKLYLPTSCQLRRLERKGLSPILSHTSESFAGRSVICAFREEERFIKEVEEKVDFFQQKTYTSMACERWLSMRLGVISDVLVLIAGILCVAYRDQLSPGLIGLSMSMALTVTGNMQLQVRVASLLEMDIVSVERILQYINLPSEAPRHLPCPGYTQHWPQTGDIIFKDICVQYRKGLDLVLKKISFHVQDGEKVGIVGRTGAGKSSLLLTLFRLVEPCDGQIFIDGLDISKLGLYDLRQKLTILPQDPVLFTGTLRTNLDPFDEFQEKEIWTSLEHCHLKSFVKNLPEGLDYEVGEGGTNLSIGQRQLVCLGRALLRKTKILVLDEATAAVDVETDELIQKTIRSEFQGCTVLTIAHRLNTVMDYDRILVLDKGRIAEFDSPAVLLNDVNSLFYKMSAESQALRLNNS
ncbi:multidrug resistance-associated protein 1-like isoform X2 [Physella acuta]|uniref:multidrug resistance-associated protein 1-like isoform X2 n=1 Tax=Physella acuta TaxID=109671 RepID=UPI0027DBDA38|nr:multidrug resistance-associated protein 1-like isoform X2 [Physella acuta]